MLNLLTNDRHLKTLNVDYNKFEKDSFNTVINFLLGHNIVKQFTCSYSSVGDLMMTAIGKGLQINKKLKHLNLSNNKITVSYIFFSVL